MLRGTGGITLGLPFLPSLVPVKGYAAELNSRHRNVSPPSARFTAASTTPRCSPRPKTLTKRQEMYPDHGLRWGNLPNGGNLSGIMQNVPGNIAKKMNVLFGSDIPFYIGHHTGGYLGHLAVIKARTFALS